MDDYELMERNHRLALEEKDQDWKNKIRTHIEDPLAVVYRDFERLAALLPEAQEVENLKIALDTLTRRYKSLIR
jgi:hypothetical protein